MRVLYLVRVLNIAYGAGIAIMLVASLAAPGFLFDALGFKVSDAWSDRTIAIRVMMIIGIVGAWIGHRILTTLIRIVDSVRSGDPFTLRNTAGIQTIAWLVLAAEILHLMVGWLVDFISTPAQPFDTGSRFSLTPWIAVLMLFVLAQVFDHGARMREDLEGTV